jgi:acetyl esterase/lipase
MDFHPSMSRMLNVGDPLLPLGVLLALGRSYDIQHGSGVADYLKQPLLTPPSILRKFPPTFFMVGGYDPFLDDSVSWHMRIAAAGAPTRLHIYPDLSHGFLSFSKLVPAARPALRDLDRYLAEQFQRA